MRNVIAFLILVFTTSYSFASGGTAVYQDDSCNAMTGLTGNGRPCRPDALPGGPAGSGYRSPGYDEGYQKGYEDGLRACQAGGASSIYEDGRNAGNGTTARDSVSGSAYPGDVNSCVSTYYDPSYYNWLAFKNICNYPIVVVSAFSNGAGGGSRHLKPGQHQSSGYNAKEIQAKGTLQIASCPEGFLSVLPDNQYKMWSKYGEKFVCRKQ